MAKLISFVVILFTFSSQSAFAASSIPESRNHARLSFQGKRLPAELSFADAPPPVVLYVGKGAWDSGVEHLKMFLTEHQIGYRTAVGTDIEAGFLDENGVRLLIMPGGESWEYLAELGASGADRIRRFIDDGGGYAGICAGAFYATSHRLGGYATGPYGIGLLEGTAYDGTALNTPPFIEGMMDIDILPTFLTAGFKSLYRIVMFGGPSFRYTAEEAAKKHIQVMARFQVVNEPAMVAFQYGKGRVFLSGPHLEIEEERTSWGTEYVDPDSEWPILHRVVKHLMR